MIFSVIAVTLPATIPLLVNKRTKDGKALNKSGTTVTPKPTPTAHAIINKFLEK